MSSNPPFDDPEVLKALRGLPGTRIVSPTQTPQWLREAQEKYLEEIDADLEMLLKEKADRESSGQSIIFITAKINAATRLRAQVANKHQAARLLCSLSGLSESGNIFIDLPELEFTANVTWGD